jgi:hypothetical protein
LFSKQRRYNWLSLNTTIDPQCHSILEMGCPMSKSILDVKPLSLIRRNHGLEHATIHMLSKKFPHLSFAGISSPLGFTIIGDVSSEDVAEAAIEALKKLRAGETDLAFHPNCGTNFAVAGMMAGLGAWIGTIGSEDSTKGKLERLPLMMSLAMAALVITRPLGPYIQKNITTTGDPDGLELTRVETSVRGGLRMHRVTTAG